MFFNQRSAREADTLGEVCMRMRGTTGMALMCVIGVVLLTGYLNHKDEVDQARITWEVAVSLYRPSVRANTLLYAMGLHRATIIAEGIASLDSFRVVQNRLNELRDEYWRLANEAQPTESGIITLSDM